MKLGWHLNGQDQTSTQRGITETQGREGTMSNATTSRTGHQPSLRQKPPLDIEESLQEGAGLSWHKPCRPKALLEVTWNKQGTGMGPQTESAAWELEAREVETWFLVQDTGELCALSKDTPAPPPPQSSHGQATCTGSSSALCSLLDWHR